ncbi:MAG: hypothetical protein JXR58_05385 [Bacteroidales bacterium]|nr:hypothetical protein [Bacteroidales bacterium]
MKKDDLIKSASKLKQPSAEAITEFSSKSDSMVNMINERLSRRNDIVQLIGEGNIEMMADNHHNHMRFMISLFNDYNPVVFTETVLWVFRAYRTHGFKLTYWPAQLDNWVDIFKKELTKDCYNQIYPFYNWMIVNNPIFAGVSDQTISDDLNPSIGRHE